MHIGHVSKMKLKKSEKKFVTFARKSNSNFKCRCLINLETGIAILIRHFPPFFFFLLIFGIQVESNSEFDLLNWHCNSVEQGMHFLNFLVKNLKCTCVFPVSVSAVSRIPYKNQRMSKIQMDDISVVKNTFIYNLKIRISKLNCEFRFKSKIE